MVEAVAALLALVGVAMEPPATVEADMAPAATGGADMAPLVAVGPPATEEASTTLLGVTTVPAEAHLLSRLFRVTVKGLQVGKPNDDESSRQNGLSLASSAPLQHATLTRQNAFFDKSKFGARNPSSAGRIIMVTGTVIAGIDQSSGPTSSETISPISYGLMGILIPFGDMASMWSS